ncbi:SHOCT domain-containing protein [Sphingobium xenophagum]|uniref:SHOCT domain-containing protein n=1 Tax=Sphingobium xenophagum TaxID=121428 RepID=UPI0009D99286|nr:SHOCT domain-containing protein [Sphingobium xenophagum]
MRFELSERIYTTRNENEVMDAILRGFKRVAETSKVSGHEIVVTDVKATFGSINRKDSTKINLERVQGGFEIVADVRYRPSALFWVFIFFGLIFYGIGWTIPAGFYFWHKGIVRKTIQETLSRVADSFSHEPHASSHDITANNQSSSTDDLIKLAALRDRGYITDEEFSEQKSKILRLK